ncbi:hypothetical protein A4X09_0g7164 [Tilletia walkeri]|uniref:Uncharacterized protein n=1 Tax=Tilletia walkeri TaxID=117179 RepID=A0A8X7T1P5_9BASI|nr:hypothetical protein A4X09_0g7164 [Tilletia walkeri]
MLLEGNGTPRIVEATLTSQSKRHALVWEQCGTNKSKKEPRCLKLKIGLQQSLHMRVYLDPCVRSPGKPSARCDFTLGCGPVEPLSSQQIEELAAVHKLTIQDARTCVISIQSVACGTVSPTIGLTTLRRGPDYARMAARLQQILVGPFGTAVMPLLKREGEEVVIPIFLLARDSSVPHGGHHCKIILTNPVRLPPFRGLDLGMEPVWKAAYHAFQHPTGLDTEADQVGEDTVDAQIDRDLIDELEETLAAETKTIRHCTSQAQHPAKHQAYSTRSLPQKRPASWSGIGLEMEQTAEEPSFAPEATSNHSVAISRAALCRSSRRSTKDRALGAYRKGTTERSTSGRWILLRIWKHADPKERPRILTVSYGSSSITISTETGRAEFQRGSWRLHFPSAHVSTAA